MSVAEPVELLSRALTLTEELMERVDPKQLSLTTPCGSWNVQSLLNHLVRELGQFTVIPQGGTPDWGALADTTGGDGSAQEFREGAASLLAAWSVADLETMVPSFGTEAPLSHLLMQQIAEFSVHSWDLAVATGQSRPLDEEAAEAGLEWARGALNPIFRGSEAEGKAFGPEVSVPADAPAPDRLAGFFGRTPPPTR